MGDVSKFKIVYGIVYSHPEPIKKATPFGVALWELTDSNRRPSACKADALNQLS
jgi:hypothetical protein